MRCLKYKWVNGSLPLRSSDSRRRNRVFIKYKWLLEPYIRFNDSTRAEIVLPAEVGEGYKGAKTVGIDLGVVKAVK